MSEARIDSNLQRDAVREWCVYDGWHPGRQVSVDPWVRERSRAGERPWCRTALAFLREFGDLLFPRRLVSAYWAPSEVSTKFDAGITWPGRFESFEKCTGVIVDTVARLDDGNAFLGSADPGVFFVTTVDGPDDPIGYVGASGIEAVVSVLGGFEAVEIPWAAYLNGR